MEMLMCRACGEFVPAFSENGEVRPFRDDCPGCGGQEFKHNATEAVVRTGDRAT